MFWTKRAHESTILQIFECCNESPFNSSCHFGNHKVRVYLNFAWLFNVLKDNSSVFVWLKPYIVSTKRSHWSEIFRLLSGWVKLTKFLLYLKPKVSFSLNFASLCFVKRDNCPVLFELKLYIIWTKGPSKGEIEDFWLLTRNFTKFVLW